MVQFKSRSGAQVRVYGTSGAEGQDLAGTDPIDLQLPRGATSSGTPNVNALSNTFDRHEEFVANDAISWTLSKFS